MSIELVRQPLQRKMDGATCNSGILDTIKIEEGLYPKSL